MESLGIDPKLIFAQIVNFAILLWLLNKFLYKPLIKVLDERKQKQEEALRKFEEAQKKGEELALEKEKTLREIKETGERMIVEAKREAQKHAEEIIIHGKEAAKKEAEKGTEVVQEELRKALKKVEEKSVDIGVTIAEKLMREKITPDEKRKLLRKIIIRH
jgi:F-type H+-transporting ATPase subunit b